MGKQIRFVNILVGSVVLYIAFRLWWNGYIDNIPFLMAGENPYSIVNPLANSLFGTLLLLGLDAVNFIGEVTIKGLKFAYFVLYDIINGTKTVSDILKNQPVDPIEPIKTDKSIEPVEQDAPTTNELLLTIISNQNNMNDRLNKIEGTINVTPTGNL